jgi:ribosomal protein S11
MFSTSHGAGQVHNKVGWGVADLSASKNADVVAVTDTEDKVVEACKSEALHQLPIL